MQQKPYRSAWRVFWITDNGSSHRGQTSIERLSKWYPNAIQVHTPFTSCKKMEQGFADLLAKAGKKSWVVYSKKPFAGPEQVLEYLGRYTHRIAISNNRVKSIGGVTFTYKNRKRMGESKRCP